MIIPFLSLLAFASVVSGQPRFLPLTSVRSLDGSDGNNGARTNSRLMRMAGYDYPKDGSGDAIQTLPNVRKISNRCLRQRKKQMPNSRGLTEFIDHDMDLTPSDISAGSEPIAVTMVADPMGRGSTIDFTRALYDPSSGTAERPREHINLITPVIDASVVYGSDFPRARFLRSFEGGKMKTYNDETKRSRILPPLNTAGFDNEGNHDFNPTSLFICGDLRANEQLTLFSLHALFVREHNRLCDIIQKQHPESNDEQIYQFARKLVGMEIQKIPYEDWLPAIFLDQWRPHLIRTAVMTLPWTSA